MVNWMTLAETMDQAIDREFGVTINLIPWGDAMTNGLPDPFKEGGADMSRARRDGIKALFVRPDASIKAVKGGESTNMVEADVIISIRTSLLGDLREKDRCEIPQQAFIDAFLGEVNFITPGDTGRSLLHLIKVKQE
jgi:hypothetical protein